MRHGGVRGRRSRRRRDRRRLNENSKVKKSTQLTSSSTKNMSSTIDASLFRTLQKNIYFLKIFLEKFFNTAKTLLLLEAARSNIFAQRRRMSRFSRLVFDSRTTSPMTRCRTDFQCVSIAAPVAS
jgi:hypothetical protein